MSAVKNVFIQVIRKPERKVIMKRGIKAEGYFEYYGEAIAMIQDSMKKYDPSVLGYRWDDANSPRIIK